MKLRLHNYWRSSASHRVRIALRLKGLAFEYVPVDITGGEQGSAAYRARNPMQQVPTLEVIQDEGASHFLSQSLAILEFLEERFPDPALLPKDSFLRARTRTLAEIVNAGIQPFQNMPAVRRVGALGGDGAAWIRDFNAAGLRAFASLAAESAGRFCVGDTPTLADCCLVPQLHSARRFEVSLDGLELLVRIADTCEKLPAFAAAAPAAQPDARPS